MNFKEWVVHFKNVDRPIGDLANDISSDDNFPSVNDESIIRKYLEDKVSVRSTTAVLETFQNAWKYYLMDRP